MVIYLRDPAVAALVRQRWDASLGSAMRVCERASQTWLRHRPGTYLEVRVDQLHWRICDQVTWRTIGDAWLAVHQQPRR